MTSPSPVKLRGALFGLVSGLGVSGGALPGNGVLLEVVKGHRVPYVRNSRHEASRAGRLLTAACDWLSMRGGWSSPVNASEATVRTAPQDVSIVPSMQLHRWFRKQRVALSDDQVDEVYEAARRSVTWSGAL